MIPEHLRAESPLPLIILFAVLAAMVYGERLRRFARPKDVVISLRDGTVHVIRKVQATRNKRNALSAIRALQSDNTLPRLPNQAKFDALVERRFNDVERDQSMVRLCIHSARALLSGALARTVAESASLSDLEELREVVTEMRRELARESLELETRDTVVLPYLDERVPLREAHIEEFCRSCTVDDDEFFVYWEDRHVVTSTRIVIFNDDDPPTIRASIPIDQVATYETMRRAPAEA